MTITHALSEGENPDFDFPIEWDSPELLFVVREPFVSNYTQADIVFGGIETGAPMRIISEMPEGGVIFSDGMINEGIEFNAGSVETITVAEKTAKLVL